MLPVTVQCTAAGASAWVPLDYTQRNFAVGYYCDVLGGASLTYKTQHGFYNPSLDQEDVKSITRSTTTATLTWFTGRSVAVGDSLVITGAGAPLDGTYDVASVTSATVVTYTVANSGATAALPGPRCQLIRVEDDPSVVGKTASTSGNLAFPVNAIRLNVTTYASGRVSMTVNQGR